MDNSVNNEINENKIDWDNAAWKSIDNLKNYIRKYGNSAVSLNEMNQEELLHLARCTEKAQILINEGNSQCLQCHKIVDCCECDRCNQCYCVPMECKCPPQKMILTKKLVFLKSNSKKINLPQIVDNVVQNAQSNNQNNNQNSSNNGSNSSNEHNEVNESLSNNGKYRDEIMILSYKIKLKLFIMDKINKYKNKNLNDDILLVMNLIVFQHCNPNETIKDNNKRNIVELFEQIDELDIDKQKQILHCMCSKLT